MTIESLLEKFENGDIPTASDYEALIRNCYNNKELITLTSKQEELTVLLKSVSNYEFNNFVGWDSIPPTPWTGGTSLVTFKNYNNDDDGVSGDYLLVNKNSFSGLLGREFLIKSKKIAINYYFEPLKISIYMPLELTDEIQLDGYIVFKALTGLGLSAMRDFAPDQNGSFERKCHIVQIDDSINLTGGVYQQGSNELEILDNSNLIIVNKATGNYINITHEKVDINGANDLNLNSFNSDINLNASKKLNVTAGNMHFAANQNLYIGSLGGKVIIHSPNNDIQIISKKIEAPDLTIQDIESTGVKSLITLEMLDKKINDLRTELGG